MMGRGFSDAEKELRANIREWLKEHGEGFMDVLECYGPIDNDFVSALVKFRDSFFMRHYTGYPCDQTKKAKDVLGPFIRGGEVPNIEELREAVIIQNMNLSMAQEEIWNLKRRRSEQEFNHRFPRRERIRQIFG